MPIKMPKFLVTTVEPTSQVGDTCVFNAKSSEAKYRYTKLFLKDMASVEGKYVNINDTKLVFLKDRASIEWKYVDINDEGKTKKWNKDEGKDKGEGGFSGTVVSQAEFTSPNHSPH